MCSPTRLQSIAEVMLKIHYKPGSNGWHEQRVIAALGKFFDYRVHTVFPRVHLWSWESDLLVVTKSMRAWEVEIKTSLSDWKADSKKSKWAHPDIKKISRFYYAVPDDLLIPIPNGAYDPVLGKMIKYAVPDFVPSWAGVLRVHHVEDRDYVSEIRKPQQLSTYKLPAHALISLMKSTYYRFWSQESPCNHEVISCTDSELYAVETP